MFDGPSSREGSLASSANRGSWLNPRRWSESRGGDDEFGTPKKLLQSSEWWEGLEDEVGLLVERLSAVEVWYLELLWL